MVERKTEKKNILYFGHYTTSHRLTNIGRVFDLQATGKYNITLMQPWGSTYTKDLIQRGINVIETPLFMMPEEPRLYKQFPTYNPKHLSFHIFYSNYQGMLDHLRAQHFDMIITEYHPHVRMLARFLRDRVPLHVISYPMLEPSYMLELGVQPYHSVQPGEKPSEVEWLLAT